MPASAKKAIGSNVSPQVMKRMVQSSRRNNDTASIDCVNATSDGKGGDRRDEEIVDLVEEEGDEDGDSEDGDEDQVIETGSAQSERGKQPIFHHEIYNRLVHLMSSLGAYTYEPPDHGIGSMDITSFHPGQRDWSSTRAHRAPILTLWSEPPKSAPTYPIGYLLFNGRLMLDYAGNPIRAFRNLPLTISSAVKGFRLETWIRQDIHRLRIDDILARLRTRNTPSGRQPLQRRGDLTDRTNAFRSKSGLVTFRPRNEATKLAAIAYMDSLRTAAQRASNRATDRDLTPDQLATLKELSKRVSIHAAAGSSASVNASSPNTVSDPASTVSPTSRPSRHRRPSPARQPTPAPLTTPAPTQPLPDSRDDVPQTCKEAYLLRDALEETVEHFKKLTGQNPKPTATTKSYSSQWNTLQAQFAPIWKSQRPAEETPFLFKLRNWTGGIGRWAYDWRMQVGGEERDREGEIFGRYMDAMHGSTAYLGPDGSWRSVRDTWCNSRFKPTVGRLGRRDPTSEEEGSEGDSEKDCDDDFKDTEYHDGTPSVSRERHDNLAGSLAPKSYMEYSPSRFI